MGARRVIGVKPYDSESEKKKKDCSRSGASCLWEGKPAIELSLVETLPLTLEDPGGSRGVGLGGWG